MEQLLHTPEGVRDIYHEECAKKLALQNRLHKTLHLYGYHDIQTPMYEYFDVFRKESEPFLQGNYINFLTETATHWC